MTITCFAASYLVAWLLEVVRLFFRSGLRRAFMLGFAVAGLFAHTTYLTYRALEAEGSPLSSSFDWYLLVAWLLVGALLYVTYYYPQAALGLVVLPLATAIVGAAALFAERTPIAPQPASQVWGTVHGVFLLLGSVTVMVGFVAALLYLWQASRLKRKRPSLVGFHFPSLELLEKVNSRALPVSLLMVAGGFVSGVILALVKAGRGQPPRWSDPAIWSSALMLAWLLVATTFNAVYQPARHGRKTAYLAIVSFALLVLMLGVFLLADQEHGAGREPKAEAGTPRPPGPAGRLSSESLRRAALPCRPGPGGHALAALATPGATASSALHSGFRIPDSAGGRP